MTDLDSLLRVPADALRLGTDPASLGFRTTAEIEPIFSVIGQDQAVDALRFGLATDAQGHNVYVRGLTGTGRMTLLRQLLTDVQPFCPLSHDHCYVHDFDRPEAPALVTLPRGRGRAFGQAVEELVDFVARDLAATLESDAVRARRAVLDQELRQQIAARTDPFEAELRENGLTVVDLQVGDTHKPFVFPLVEGEPVPPERFQQLVQEGTIAADDARDIRARIERWSEKLAVLHRQLFELHRTHRNAVKALHAEELRQTLELETGRIAAEFAVDAVRRFLAAVTTDLVGHVAEGRTLTPHHLDLYRVNVLSTHADGDGCPILIETRPSLTNLMGTIEREFPRDAPPTPDHLLIRAGSLLRADGGYLILDVRDLLGEPGAWRALVRTLRAGRLQIAPLEASAFGTHAAIKPEPIGIQVKVILVGDAQLFYALDGMDPDFPHLFKVLVDFDTEIPRDADGARRYAGVLARIAADRRLRPFTAAAVAALVEHGARIAGHAHKLTARFGRLVDIAQEASFLAERDGAADTDASHVIQAIRRGRARADLPARRFRERILDGSIRVATSGAVTGQVNGLAVISAGPLTFGFPQRITAAIGAGTDGTIDIESAAQLSGSIHTKGFAILGGLLRELLPLDHPLAFRASLAFEQSYGGVDGDSASGAEFCCLISALTRIPLRQDLAMTGAIDQKGNVQPIGAANEKIEGFFDVCAAGGLTGTQGVILPRANARELMLRREVVEACREGRFHVYAVETIQQALELFLGRPAGVLDARGRYPADSILGIAVARAREYWEMVSSGPKVSRDAAP